MNKRQWYGLSIFIFSLLLWFTRSDTLMLVVREREVLFNRYSEGHFGVLFVVTLLLWVIVACLWSKRPLDKSLFGDALTGIVMTVITVLLSVYATHWMTKPRYIESKTDDNANAAIVRHRPPNTVEKFTWIDKPEHPRSYPNPPSGYGEISGTLTTDKNGFRNQGTLREQYDIVVAGDSFAASSHVSDEQAWTVLLNEKTGKSIYNLGVSGSAPITYLTNYKQLGITLKPSVTIFVIYEGNDFKADGIPANLFTDNKEKTVSLAASTGSKTYWNDVKQHIEYAFKASPITRGLKVVSQTYFETTFADGELRKYSRINDVMPMKVTQNGKTSHYAFDPKRLAYLFNTEDAFKQSKEWLATEKIIDAMAQLAINNGSKPVFVYVPSTPHVVIPFAGDLPARQLQRFISYVRKNPAESPEKTKQLILDNLDSLENVFMENCKTQQFNCLSLTPALQQAMQQGIQTYYSYDQHWTPEGNKVVAKKVAEFLTTLNL